MGDLKKNLKNVDPLTWRMINGSYWDLPKSRIGMSSAHDLSK